MPALYQVGERVFLARPHADERVGRYSIDPRWFGREYEIRSVGNNDNGLHEYSYGLSYTESGHGGWAVWESMLEPVHKIPVYPNGEKFKVVLPGNENVRRISFPKDAVPEPVEILRRVFRSHPQREISFTSGSPSMFVGSVSGTEVSVMNVTEGE